MVKIMCGRYTLYTDGTVIAQQFELTEVPVLEPHYNIAPTQPVAVVRQTQQGRALHALRWGLVPPWAKDPAIGSRMINARAETVAEKPSFRSALRRRRCLVLADGFYEWQAVGKGPKQPFYIHLKDKQPFVFAGLWEVWGDTHNQLESCTIITTTPNALMQPIHNRMPVILPPEQYATWLDPELTDTGPLTALLQPYTAEKMDAYPVSRTVNRALHDSPDCIAPLAATAE